MFGAAEPRLRDLDPAVVARAGRLRSVVDPERLHDLVAALPAPRVRLHRPEVMAAVDEMLLDAFRTAGWRAELRQFDEPARWAWADADNPSRITPVKSLRGVNVVAIKPGSSLDSLIVVAHHDTVPGSGGADDNGSGVVALMELARLLAPVRLRRSVVLAAVDHEELGFFGSRRLVGELLAERRIVGAVVFEMLGYTCAARGSQMLPAGVGAVYRGQVRRLRAGGHAGRLPHRHLSAGGTIPRNMLRRVSRPARRRRDFRAGARACRPPDPRAGAGQSGALCPRFRSQ